MSESREFWGREDELKQLREAFDACASSDEKGRFVGGPRMVFTIAESGIGKSRLVQELYLQLTRDPNWDPLCYWPDAFLGVGDQLRTVPDMSGHEPEGPPRFVWLGGRWQATDVRNVQEQQSILPALIDSITVHTSIQEQHGSVWASAKRRIVKEVGGLNHDDSAEEFVGIAAEKILNADVLPFGGLLYRLGKGAVNLFGDRSDPHSREQIEDALKKSTIDEVLECVRELLGGKGAVPTVLWLDDAQWIDKETTEFLDRLWANAKKGNWPLLVVVTHWEHEWRDENKCKLDQFKAEQDGVSQIYLKRAGDDSLGKYLDQQLPGLTSIQRELLLGKAAGNFLTMTENIKQLLSTARNFVDGNTGKALIPAAERRIETWESDRDKRVEQRFGEMEEKVRDVLGWSSRIGISFMSEVVQDFAAQSVVENDALQLIERCVDPYVVLARVSENLREFRDKAYFKVARKHYEDYLAEGDEEILSAVLKRRLAEWINNTFSAEGDMLRPDKAHESTAPQRSVAALAIEEQRNFLKLATRELTFPDMPDWENEEHVAALRAVVLFINLNAKQNLWAEIRHGCEILENLAWDEMPKSVISGDELNILYYRAWTSGGQFAAGVFARSLLGRRQDQYEALVTPQTMLDLADSLNNVARIEQDCGELDAALVHYKESLTVRRQLVAKQDTPGSRRMLAVGITNVAYAELVCSERDAVLVPQQKALAINRQASALKKQGTPVLARDLLASLENIFEVEKANSKFDAALVQFQESLAIMRQLAAELDTPASRRDLAATLNYFATIEKARGKQDAELVCYQESLAITRQLAAELDTPASRRELAISLTGVALIEKDRGELDAALVCYQESLAITRQLAAELDTPASRRELAFSLTGVGRIEKDRGELDAALACYQESLAITRQLAAELDTPTSRRELAISMTGVALIEKDRGELDAALVCYQESLAITRQLAAELGTQESLRELGMSLSLCMGIEQACGNRKAMWAYYEEMRATFRQMEE